MKQLSSRGFEEVAKRFRLLGDPSRLKILDFLRREGEQTVGAVAEATGHSAAQASRHLAHLGTAGFLTRRQVGTTVYYKIDDPSVFDLCEIVCGRLEACAADSVKALYASAKPGPRRSKS